MLKTFTKAQAIGLIFLALEIINALLWVALGCFCLYATLEEERVGGFAVVLVAFGAVCVFNGLALILKLRLWRISSRVLGVIMILYGLDVLFLGHGEDVGGTAPWFTLIGASMGLGVWSVALPSYRSCRTARSQQAASPNGGPAEPFGNSGVGGGPPSVT